jgi:hypothetical protein
MPSNQHLEAVYRATLAAATPGIFHLYSPVNGKITKVSLYSNQAPVGDAVFDVNLHATLASSGVSIFASDPTQRPKILSGQFSGSTNAPAATNVFDGQMISIDADTIPSDVGQDLVVIVTILEAATRVEHTVTTSNIANDASENVTLDFGYTFVVLRVVTDFAAWVRIYNSAAAQSADSARPITTDPEPGSGVIAEIITATGLLDIMLSPQPIGSSQEATPTIAIPITITNKSGASHAIELTVTSLELEI